MKAVQLREVDKNYRTHQQAFLNLAVRAEKKVGKNKSKPVYKTFSSFYDYRKEVEKILPDKKKQSRLASIGRLLRK
ncbi:MAG: hypothetical protein PHS82_06185 [Lachnospiraceae bacterium]|nr:hypothetical protein [Lachnospiraceae bacterium]